MNDLTRSNSTGILTVPSKFDSQKTKKPTDKKPMRRKKNAKVREQRKFTVGSRVRCINRRYGFFGYTGWITYRARRGFTTVVDFDCPGIGYGITFPYEMEQLRGFLRVIPPLHPTMTMRRQFSPGTWVRCAAARGFRRGKSGEIAQHSGNQTTIFWLDGMMETSRFSPVHFVSRRRPSAVQLILRERLHRDWQLRLARLKKNLAPGKRAQ